MSMLAISWSNENEQILQGKWTYWTKQIKHCLSYIPKTTVRKSIPIKCNNFDKAGLLGVIRTIVVFQAFTPNRSLGVKEINNEHLTLSVTREKYCLSPNQTDVFTECRCVLACLRSKFRETVKSKYFVITFNKHCVYDKHPRLKYRSRCCPQAFVAIWESNINVCKQLNTYVWHVY